MVGQRSGQTPETLPPYISGIANATFGEPEVEVLRESAEDRSNSRLQIASPPRQGRPGHGPGACDAQGWPGCAGVIQDGPSR